MMRKSIVAPVVCVTIFILLPALCAAAETLIAGTGGSPPATEFSFAIVLSDGAEWATSFTVPAGTPYTLTHLQLSAYHYPGNGAGALFTINPDTAGVPGSALATFPTNTIEAISEANAGLTLAPTSSAVLLGGQKYWIVGKALSGQMNWNFGPNVFGEVAHGSGSSWTLSPGSNVPAFAVLGVAAPEPSTFVLVVLAGGSIFIRRRGRSLAC